VGTTKVVMAIADHAYVVEISTDARSLLGRFESGGAVSGSLEAGELARRLKILGDDIRRQLNLQFDAVVARPAIDVEVSADEFAIAKARIRLRGPVPDAVRAVSWRYDLTSTVYRLDVTSNGHVDTQWLEPGQLSRPAQLVRNSDGLREAFRPFRLGFRRILPGGIEQILLIVVLVFGARRMMARGFLGFALGETIAIGLTPSLASSMSGGTAPAGTVPALVALSIACLAAESIAAPAMATGRLVRLFAAGAIHGVSLAAAVPSNLLVTVLPFVAGIQAGQATVLFMALLLVGTAAGCESRQRQVAVPAFVVIGITGFVWTLQRFL
jgi:HupE/UreJ protein